MLSLCNSQMQMFKNMAISSTETSPVTTFVQKKKKKEKRKSTKETQNPDCVINPLCTILIHSSHGWCQSGLNCLVASYGKCPVSVQNSPPSTKPQPQNVPLSMSSHFSPLWGMTSDASPSAREDEAATVTLRWCFVVGGYEVTGLLPSTCLQRQEASPARCAYSLNRFSAPNLKFNLMLYLGPVFSIRNLTFLVLLIVMLNFF